MKALDNNIMILGLQIMGESICDFSETAQQIFISNSLTFYLFPTLPGAVWKRGDVPPSQRLRYKAYIDIN